MAEFGVIFGGLSPSPVGKTDAVLFFSPTWYDWFCFYSYFLTTCPSLHLIICVVVFKALYTNYCESFVNAYIVCSYECLYSPYCSVFIYFSPIFSKSSLGEVVFLRQTKDISISWPGLFWLISPGIIFHRLCQNLQTIWSFSWINWLLCQFSQTMLPLALNIGLFLGG